MTVPIHGEAGFEGMRKAGKLAAEVLDFITPHVVPGANLEQLDKMCHDFILDHGATPAPLNYRGFPKSTCISPNEIVCHGIPGGRYNKEKFSNGDITNIDITVILDGWHGDTSRMFTVGDKIKPVAQKLIKVTFDSLWKGIEQVKPGNTLRDVARAIQTHAEANNFYVVRDFCGHGLGEKFHTPPSVLHYVDEGNPEQDLVFEKGMFLTIEPMINTRSWKCKVKPDDWTAVVDVRGGNALSAQFEHSLAVTDDGYEIFTRSPKGWDCPPYNGA